MRRGRKWRNKRIRERNCEKVLRGEESAQRKTIGQVKVRMRKRKVRE